MAVEKLKRNPSPGQLQIGQNGRFVIAADDVKL